MKQFLPPLLRRKIGRIRRRIARKTNSIIGVDFVADIRSRLPNFEVKNIFDVGAHIGITTIEFSDGFPQAAIHAFEPSLENLSRLQANFPNNPQVHTYQIAFGEKKTNGEFLFLPDHPSTSKRQRGAIAEAKCVC